jgi:hypothetical protein
LLLTLWFEEADSPEKPYLGLFKLEPGERDQVALKTKAGKFLLDLAVERIQWALPEPDKVLKWALIPHPPTPPEEPQFDLKIRDLQSRDDPALYFTAFLGCAPLPSARQKLGRAFSILDRLLPPGASIEPLVDGLRSEKVITAKSFTAVAKKVVLPNLDESAFEADLVTGGAGDLQVSPELVEKARIRYDLPGDIRIEGPAGAMAAVVIDAKENGSCEFRIPSPPGYTRTVIL